MKQLGRYDFLHAEYIDNDNKSVSEYHSEAQIQEIDEACNENNKHSLEEREERVESSHKNSLKQMKLVIDR